VVNDEMVRYMVNRFLGWRLPKPWNPDNGISYVRPNYAHPPADHDWPVGTNLFDATQAEAMVRYMLEGLPALAARTTPQPTGASAASGAVAYILLGPAGKDGYRELTAAADDGSIPEHLRAPQRKIAPGFAWHPLFTHPAGAGADADRMEDALHQIKNWCDAYPLSMFPEPDFAKAAKVLKAAGMTIDSISASNMRHVVNGVRKIVEGALPAAPQSNGESVREREGDGG
jgi:hypothetical protein